MDDSVKDALFIILGMANLISWICVGLCDSSNLLRIVILSTFIFVVAIVWGIIAYTEIPEKISEYFKENKNVKN